MIFIREKQYKANLHCHSTLSDGKLTPKELKEAYKKAGYSVLAITDHERPHDHSEMSDEDFILLTGYEAYIRPDKKCIYNKYGAEVHLNLLARDPKNVNSICYNSRCVKYVKNPIEKMMMHKKGSKKPREYTAEYVNKFIETAKENGYIVTLNHPVWSMEDYAQADAYEGYFSLEICNYSCYNSGLHEYNGALYDDYLRKGKKIFAHSADDNHNEKPLNSPASDSFGGYAMICTEDDTLTYDNIFNALEKGDFYSSMGPKISLLGIQGNRAHIECSNATRITMISGSKSAKSVYPEYIGGTVTSADFVIPDDAPYVRFSVVDKEGRFADTRGYFKGEW